MRRRVWLIGIIILLGLGFILCPEGKNSAKAQEVSATDKITPTLLEQVKNSHPATTIRVIVGLTFEAPPLVVGVEGTREERLAAIELQKFLLSPEQDKIANDIVARGGRVLERYWLINALFVEVPAGAIVPLAQRDDVRYVQENMTAPPPLTTAVGSTRTNVQPTLWAEGVDGSTATIALIDTGVSMHPDIAPAVIFSKDYVTNDYKGDYTGDWCEHGTMAAGVIASRGTQSGKKGFAFGAKLLNLKVYGDIEIPSPHRCGAISNAIVSALQEAHAQGARIVMANVQMPQDDTAVIDAGNNAYENGCAVIAAAGNTSPPPAPPGSIKAPALAKKVMGVAAFNNMSEGEPQLMDYSNRGPAPDGRRKPDVGGLTNLHTPGVTHDANGNEILLNDVVFTGTSCATPAVAGLTALVRHKWKNTYGSFPHRGLLYAILLNMGQGTTTLLNNDEGAGWARWDLQRLDQTDALTFTRVGESQWVTFTHNAGGPLVAAIWWSEPQTTNHRRFDLRIYDFPDENELAADLDPTSVGKRIRLNDPGGGTYEMEVRLVSGNVPSEGAKVFYSLR